MLLRLALTLSLALAACADRHSPRCRDVCNQGERCAEELDDPNYKLDEDECIAACAFLEGDDKGKEMVLEYVACVEEAAGDCERIRACD